jgi:hypothetical protein
VLPVLANGMLGGLEFSACCVKEQVMSSCPGVEDGFTVLIWWGTISFRGNMLWLIAPSCQACGFPVCDSLRLLAQVASSLCPSFLDQQVWLVCFGATQ